jgi:hypothetical protein
MPQVSDLVKECRQLGLYQKSLSRVTTLIQEKENHLLIIGGDMHPSWFVNLFNTFFGELI